MKPKSKEKKLKRLERQAIKVIDSRTPYNEIRLSKFDKIMSQIATLKLSK